MPAVFTPDPARFERLVEAVAVSKLPDAEFVAWVKRSALDVLEGFDAECPECETSVHEGECVKGEEPYASIDSDAA